MANRRTETQAALALAHTAREQMMTAMRLTGELEALPAQRSVLPYHIAKIYAAGGNKEKCFAWLEKAYEEGNPDLIVRAGIRWPARRRAIFRLDATSRLEEEPGNTGLSHVRFEVSPVLRLFFLALNESRAANELDSCEPSRSLQVKGKSANSPTRAGAFALLLLRPGSGKIEQQHFRILYAGEFDRFLLRDGRAVALI